MSYYTFGATDDPQEPKAPSLLDQFSKVGEQLKQAVVAEQKKQYAIAFGVVAGLGVLLYLGLHK